jgi:hypothetical protein
MGCAVITILSRNFYFRDWLFGLAVLVVFNLLQVLKGFYLNLYNSIVFIC